jgi:hypothetical protein
LGVKELLEIDMSSVFEKLNLKEHSEIVVVSAPPSFETELTALKGVTVLRDLKMAKAVHFALVFATQQKEVDGISKVLADKAQGDALLWFAYPKGTSKNYKCDFNRDTGWNVIRSVGFDTVRAVAIDEDWSALRFRRVEFIKPSVKESASKSK